MNTTTETLAKLFLKRNLLKRCGEGSQNKNNLMDELKKIVRVMKKYDESAPHEIMLTLDAGTGQNAISQAKLFNEAVGLTGISLTKLDGTAKGGVIFAIADQFKLPIRFIGVGRWDNLTEEFLNIIKASNVQRHFNELMF